MPRPTPGLGGAACRGSHGGLLFVTAGGALASPSSAMVWRGPCPPGPVGLALLVRGDTGTLLVAVNTCEPGRGMSSWSAEPRTGEVVLAGRAARAGVGRP